MKGSIRQRSPGTWELTIDAGRDPLGRRRRKYVTVRGTKAQAQRKLRELLSTMDRGIDISTDKILLRDWLDRWMRDVIIPQRRQNTRERYQGIIRLHINPALGNVEIAKLSPYQVQAFESSLTVSGMAPEGVGLVHRVMSGAMRYAMRMEIVHRNTVSLVSPPPVAKRETHAPTVQAVRDTLSLAKSENHHLLACIHLIAFTGVRRGEALGLTWDNVNLHAGQMRIVASLVKTRGQGILLELPKTASGRRVIDLDAGTADVLIDHRARQDDIKQTMRDAYNDRGRVFSGAQGEWINPAQLTRAIRSLGDRCGVQDLTVRSLRHFHASVMLQSGQNPVVVSKRLGHANVSITSDIYAHSLPGWQKQAATSFAEAMETRA